MTRHVGITADRRVAGMRAQHQQLADLFRIQGQKPLVVLEQHDGLGRRFARQGDRFRRRRQTVGLGRVDIGIFERAAEELDLEDTAHRHVDFRLGDAAGLHQFQQLRIGRRIRGFDVNAGLDGAISRFGQVGDQVVAGDQFVDGEIVGDRDALEAPLIAQDGRQQPLVGVRRDAVDFVVRRHDRARIGFLDDLLERRKEVLAQVAFTDLGRTDIGAVFRLAVTGHVLQRGEDLVRRQRQGLALEAQHGRLAHFAAQVRVLAVGFLDAAPARFARHIDDRRQHVVAAAGAGFLGGHGEDARRGRRIEGRGQADRLRERGRILGDEAVQAFLVHDHRNAQPRAFDGPLLHGVDQGRGFQRVAVGHSPRIAGAGHGRDPDTVARTRDHAHAVRIGLLRLGGVEITLGVEDGALLLPQTFHLGDLFLQRHALDQVVDARRHRRCRILVQKLAGHGSGLLAGFRLGRSGARGDTQRQRGSPERTACQVVGHDFRSLIDP